MRLMKQIDILLVEDNEGDILLISEALEEGKVINSINIARDGEKAIDYLEKRGGNKEAISPDLIILDVNLPRKNGHEVLEYVKESEHLKHIPVIMLTTSSSEKDIIKSYKNHANCYITKPVEADAFLDAVTSIERFWISLVQLPGN
jgi:CheY-like chemotaxis protein